MRIMFNNNNQIFRFMKKIKYFGLMGAIALTSAIGFTACSSDDSATADVNPTYDGTSVRTDFAFNVTKASQDTRMSGKNVQEGTGNGFLGMKEMYLLPFDDVPSAASETNYTSGSVRNYALGTLNNTSDITQEKSSKVYSLTLPVGTNNFLFYGKADGETTPNGLGRNFEKGAVTSNLNNSVFKTSDIHFDLTSITTSLDKDGTEKDATYIAQYLTNIANAQYTDNSTNPATVIKWSETVDKATTDGTYSAIALLYTKFTTNITQYAGSKEAVERLVFDLYKTAYAINAQSSVEDVQNIAKAICKAIETPYNNVVLKVQKSKSITDEVSIDDNVEASTASDWVATLEGTHFTTDASDINVKHYFPANLGLPMGAAQLNWDGAKFEYKTTQDIGNYPVTPTSATTSITDFRYPSEIIYFDNSPLRATNEYKQVIDYPVTTSDWDNLYQTETWPQTAVAATTRAVAMTNNVNYGVALLETTVKLASTSLTDNMAAIIGGKATNQTITAVEANPTGTNSVFKVTGVLVGGQPSQVGWNMIPTSNANYNSVIYDKDVTFTGPLSTTSDNTKNYTVVFDNYDPDGQKDVLIALEIVNDGCDFYGAEGLIPAGNTFYLIGKLQLTGSTNNWSGENAVKANRKPSYRITNENTKRVFVQDYKTIANLTLKDDALKRAYSAIPDLRATEVLFGLSVDLKWESGLQFNVNM